MINTTSVQITREASNLLGSAAKFSGITKSHLADVAIKYFFDPDTNPSLVDALQNLTSGRQMVEEMFVTQLLLAKRQNRSATEEKHNG